MAPEDLHSRRLHRQAPSHLHLQDQLIPDRPPPICMGEVELGRSVERRARGRRTHAAGAPENTTDKGVFDVMQNYNLN
jgi:hypothetical protein